MVKPPSKPIGFDPSPDSSVVSDVDIEPTGFNHSPDSSVVSDVDIEPTGFNPSPDSCGVSTVDNTTVKQECDSTAEEEEDNDEEVIYTSPVAHRTRSRRNNN